MKQYLPVFRSPGRTTTTTLQTSNTRVTDLQSASSGTAAEFASISAKESSKVVTATMPSPRPRRMKYLNFFKLMDFASDNPGRGASMSSVVDQDFQPRHQLQPLGHHNLKLKSVLFHPSPHLHPPSRLKRLGEKELTKILTPKSQSDRELH